MFHDIARGRNSKLPFKPWESFESMTAVLGDHYLYPSYLPANVPLDKAHFFSNYINLKSREATVDNLKGYYLQYYYDQNNASEYAEDYLHEIYITCEQDTKGLRNGFYRTLKELKEDPKYNYNSYTFLIEDREIKLQETSIYMSAYYIPDTSSNLKVVAHCRYKDMLYRFNIYFYKNDNNENHRLDIEQSNHQNEIIQYVKDEINKTLSSMTTSAKAKK